MTQPHRRIVRVRADPDSEPLPTPWVTYALLAINALVFAAMWKVGRGDVMRAALDFGAKENSLIRAGQWWRLITPIFLHGSLTHLLVNGFSLWLLGGALERIYGSRKYWLIYMAGGVAGNVISFWRSPTPSLGASGAIFGLLGAGLIFPIRFRSLLHPEERERILRQLFVMTVINLASSFLPEIDKWAHFGGFIGGAGAALFLLPDVLADTAPTRGRNRLLWGGALALVAVVLLAGWRQYRSVKTPPLHARLALELFTDPNDPWWRAILPRGWQAAQEPNQNGYRWRHPNGAQIYWTDSTRDARLPAATQNWLQTHQASPIKRLVGGQQALLARVQDKDSVATVCEITFPGRLVVISLVAPRTAPTAEGDFEFFLQNMVFLHNPETGFQNITPASPSPSPSR